MKYRVDMKIDAVNEGFDGWVEYTSRKGMDSLEMCASLAEHLKRNRCGNRVIEIDKKKERILSEWLPETQSS